MMQWIWKSDNTFVVQRDATLLNNNNNNNNIIFETTIRLIIERKEICTLHLIREQPVISEEEKKWTRYEIIPRRTPTMKYPIPLLKSNLQKAIRRKCVMASLATASQLLHQNPTELLRGSLLLCLKMFV